MKTKMFRFTENTYVMV